MEGVDDAHICTACGIQFSPAQKLPEVCPICVDDRQGIPRKGQQWTSQAKLKSGSCMNKWSKYEPGLYAVGTEPRVGIGQRAFLIQTSHGNILWDCISYLDEATIDLIKALGGLKAIVISHPHFYASNAQWSSTFGNVPVYIHEKDKKWVMWEHENVKFWNGETLRVLEGATLIHLGGHFAGGQVLHWAEGVGGKGALFTGDILQLNLSTGGGARGHPNEDKRVFFKCLINQLDSSTVSIMRSFPNHIPLSASHAHRISARLQPWEFERVYGAFWNAEIMQDGKARVEYSLQRYVQWLTEEDADL